jgi:hypothetical protein
MLEQKLNIKIDQIRWITDPSLKVFFQQQAEKKKEDLVLERVFTNPLLLELGKLRTFLEG